MVFIPFYNGSFQLLLTNKDSRENSAKIVNLEIPQRELLNFNQSLNDEICIFIHDISYDKLSVKIVIVGVTCHDLIYYLNKSFGSILNQLIHG